MTGLRGALRRTDALRRPEGPGRAVAKPRASTVVGLAIVVSLAGVSTANAQVASPAPTLPGPPALEAPLGISPGGAFLRALLIPGWGHAAIGSYGRGGFYFTAQAATVYTALRARRRIGEAQDRVRFQERNLRAQLASEGVTDPAEVQTRLDGDDTLGDLNNLLDSRQEQQEDLVALSLFLILISGVDAYVSAHLAGFPEPLDMGITPTAEGGVEVGLSLTIGR